MRPARALPYVLNVWGAIDIASAALNIHFDNWGAAAAVFQVRAVTGVAGPWTYTVGAGEKLSDVWGAPLIDPTAYALSVQGPNGFLRTFKGSIPGNVKTNLDITSSYDTARPGIALHIQNRGEASCRLRILDAYRKETTSHDLGVGETLERYCPLESSFGWYDLVVSVDSDSTFQRRLAGHVETGKHSMTDPAIGAEALRARGGRIS